MNRLIEMIDPLQPSEKYEYDAVRSVVAATDQNGCCQEFRSDALNRRSEAERGELARRFKLNSTQNTTTIWPRHLLHASDQIVPSS